MARAGWSDQQLLRPGCFVSVQEEMATSTAEDDHVGHANTYKVKKVHTVHVLHAGFGVVPPIEAIQLASKHPLLNYQSLSRDPGPVGDPQQSRGSLFKLATQSLRVWTGVSTLPLGNMGFLHGFWTCRRWVICKSRHISRPLKDGQKWLLYTLPVCISHPR